MKGDLWTVLLVLAAYTAFDWFVRRELDAHFGAEKGAK